MAKKQTVVISSGDLQKLDEALGEMKELASLEKKYEIRKAKLKDIFLSVQYSERLTDSTNSVTKDCTAPVHQDMKDAFARMDDMLRQICEQPDGAKVFCNGFSIGASRDGATLMGYRELESGKVLNLVAPYERYEDNFVLETAISHSIQEVLQYLFEGKQAPDAQMSLFDEEIDETQSEPASIDEEL